jgi:hypothetical protein
MELLKTYSESGHIGRDLLYEWATVAGAIGDHGLSAWLGGRSLADGGAFDSRQCEISLTGLGVAFRKLFFATSRNQAFATAQAACGQLGLRLKELDATSRHHFEQYATQGHENGVAELTPEQAVDALRRGVVLGANEADNDPVFFEKLVGDPDGYHYTTLLRLVDGSTGAKNDTLRHTDNKVRQRR